MSEQEHDDSDDGEFEATTDDVALRSLLRAIVQAPSVDPNALLAQVRRMQWSQGDQLSDRLVVQRELGAGGMGVVYLARDTELERLVAVKVCRRQTKEATRRMLAEARAAASVVHENVIVIHDVGTTRGLVYVSMEYVEGANLRQWLAGVRQRDEIVAVMRKAGEGLVAAHATGVVHRDFKPDNVLVGLDGRVRVADFGLARTLAPTTTTQPDATHTAGAGTPGYMAPEQLEAGELGDRADVFAYAVALHEALVGTRATSPDTIARSLPRRYRGVLEDCLQRDPNKRPAMAAVLDRLTPRRRWVLPAVIAVAAASITATAAAYANATACDEPRLAPPDWSDTEQDRLSKAVARGVVMDEATFATRIVNALSEQHARWVRLEHEVCVDHYDTGRTDAITAQAQHACLEVRAAEFEEVRDLISGGDHAVAVRAPTLVDGLTPVSGCRDPEPGFSSDDESTRKATTSVRTEIAKANSERRAGHYQLSLDRLLATTAEVEAIDRPAVRAQWLRAVANAYWALGEDERAIETARDQALPAAIESGSARLCAAIAGDLIESTGGRHEFAAAQMWGRLAHAWLVRAGEPMRDRYWLERRRGKAASQAEDREAAVEFLARALAISESLPDPSPVISADALQYWGKALVIDRERADEGLRAVRKAVRIAEEAWGAGSPPVWEHKAALATSLLFLSRDEEALPLMREVLAQAERLYGTDHFNTLDAKSELGMLLMRAGEWEQAKAALRDVIERAPESDRLMLAPLASSHHALGIMARQADEHAASAAHFERMVAIAERLEADGEAILGRALVSLASTHMSAERWPESRVAAARSEVVLTDLLGPDAPEVSFAAAARTRAATAMGDGVSEFGDIVRVRERFGDLFDLSEEHAARFHEKTYAMALRQRRRFDDAIAVLDALEPIHEELGEGPEQLVVKFERAVTLAAAGRARDAKVATEAAKAFARELGSGQELGKIEHWERTGEWRPL